MMMRMVVGLFARRRQLHTFISKEIIKPSSPTPSHLKTYNLSLFDQMNPSVYMPVIFFYPNHHPTNQAAKAARLKKSLSQTLTQYYPFSGRLINAGGEGNGIYVDCNDEGANFLEVQTDASLSELVRRQETEYLSVDQFFPGGRSWDLPPNGWGSLVMVQLTYFGCGGIALAVAISHKIGDACTLLNFVNHWAAISNDNKVPPHLLVSSCPNTNLFSSFHEYPVGKRDTWVTKKFVFPNTKLAKLKAMVEEDHHLKPTTRVEVLNSLLYRSAVNAARQRSSKGSILVQLVNMRTKMEQTLPGNYAGNMYLGITIPTVNGSKNELALSSLTARIKNEKMQLSGMTDSGMNQRVIQASEFFKILASGSNDTEVYTCTSVCGFPAYEVDFGWGKPIRMTIAGCQMKNCFLLMPTPNGKGIEALVSLEEEDMAIFQSDEQLLEFTQ